MNTPRTGRGPSSFHPYYLALAGTLLLLAVGLYLCQVDAPSLWRDEALSVGRARQTVVQIVQNQNIIDGVSSPDPHPPLYFLLLSGWRHLLGESEFAYRFFSVVAQLLAVATVTGLARRIAGAPAALLTLLFAVPAPFLWWYAREARMYALLMLAVALFLSALWPLLQRRRPARAAYGWLALAALLLVGTHYTGLFVVAAGALLLLVRRGHTGRRVITAGVLLLLLLASLLLGADLLLGDTLLAGFTARPLRVLLLESSATFAFGSAEAPVRDLWRLLPFTVTVGIGLTTLFFRARRGRPAPLLLLGGGLLLALLGFYAAQWLRPTYANPRHLTILAPFWFLLLGVGLDQLRRHVPVALLPIAGVLLFISATALQGTIANPPQIRDDVRGLAAYLEPRLRPGDGLVWHDAAMKITYDYYALEGVPARAIPPVFESDDLVIRDLFRQWTAPLERIWFVDGLGHQSGVTNILDLEWIQQQDTDFPASWANLELTLYTRPLADESLPEGAVPLNRSAGPFTVTGVRIEDAALAGSGVWISLFWRGPAGDRPETPLCFQLRDSQDTSWAETCTRLPSATSAAGDDLRRQLVWLALPAGLPPLTYDLVLSGAAETWHVAAVPVSQPAAGGEPIADLGAVAVDSLSWIDDEFRAGTWAIGDLIWRARERAPAGPAHLRLTSGRNDVALEEEIPLGPSAYPASAWRTGDQIRQPLALRIPFHLNGTYQVQLRVADGPWRNAGHISVAAWPLRTTLPAGMTPLADPPRFGQEIALAAYESAVVDDRLRLTLYWRALTRPAADYAVFIHLGRPGEPPLAQTGSEPVGYARPTGSWRTGEIIVDQHELDLPPEWPDLSLTMGLHLRDDPNARLPVTVGGAPEPTGSVTLTVPRP